MANSFITLNIDKKYYNILTYLFDMFQIMSTCKVLS